MPHRKDYSNYSQFCSAVDDYAATKNKQGALLVKACFHDGSVFTDTIERESREVSFKWYDGITVESTYNTNNFVDSVYSDGEPITIGKMKNLICKWLNNNPDHCVTEITFKIEE